LIPIDTHRHDQCLVITTSLDVMTRDGSIYEYLVRF
jgi:hypothetical protein